MFFYPPGSRIANRYEVASRPLLGGMGIVYLCMDTREDRPVALKTFKPEYLPDRAARDRFLREGTAWVELGRHPHIVRCFEVFYADPTAWLVLELVAKEQDLPDASLRSWLIPGRPMPLEQALLFALQIARGMQHATTMLPGFVHRDLKPENVLVGADHLPGSTTNRLRVTDFGLAHLLEETEVQGEGDKGKGDQAAAQEQTSEDASQRPSSPLGRTQLTHDIVGTPLYMAPEQWRGRPVSTTTDVYALGCMLSEMLSGQRAVDGHSLSELELAHCTGKLTPLPAGLPVDVHALLARCLALDAEQRYADWEQVSAALEVACTQDGGKTLPQAGEASELNRAERVQAGWSFDSMGIAYLDLGQAQVAVKYFERARATGEKEGEADLRGAALVNLGSAYRYLGDARRAIGFYEQALEIAHEMGNRSMEGVSLGNLGLAYTRLGDIQRAIECYEQALVIWGKIGARRDESGDLDNLGAAHLTLGDAQRAIWYFKKALEIHREIGDRRGEGAALGNLGNAYLTLGDTRQAIGKYKQALVIWGEIGALVDEGIDLGNLGNAYLTLGDARQAIGFYEQALEIGRKIGDRRNEGNALSRLGDAYADLGDSRRAIGFFEQALAIEREIGDLNGVAATLINMALLYTQQGNLTYALLLAQEAVQAFTRIGHPEHTQRAQALVAKLQGRDSPTSGPTPTDPAQAAFEAFQRARSPTEMHAAVTQYSFMTEPGFIQAIERVIKEQVPPEHKPAFEQRLAWLRQIATS